MTKTQFPHLFLPGHIGKLELKNRIVMAPMAACFEDSDGTFSQRAIDYFVARAKGGTGLILTGASRVDRRIEAPPTWAVPWIDSDMQIGKASDLVEAVHDYGAKICIQISAGVGRQADWASPERPPIAPSPVPSFVNPSVACHELTVKEIKAIISAHAEASKRILVAGFDMIEFHAHTGYLTDEFMTPLWNKRTDEYGGNLEGRMKFPLELIAAVRAVVGPGFPLSFRLTMDHKISGGRTLADSIGIAKRLEAASIDVLHIDGGCYESVPWIFPPNYFPEGCMVDLAAAVKKEVKIPVITVGNIKHPGFADKIIEDGKADFVCMGRQLIAEPDWGNKAMEGRTEDIRPCIMCNEFCIGRMFLYRPISCSVNPRVGKERYYNLSRSEQAKEVMVIGGGPAGMEAARVAALRGHNVTLYEKEEELGGKLGTASAPSFKTVLKELIRYLSTQLDQLRVKVELKKEITPELVERLNPEVVVLATGGSALIPPIPGIDNKNVITVVDLHKNKMRIGENVLIAGGGLTGCDTALFLSQEGKKVTIVEMLPGVASDLNPMSRPALLDMLTKNGVRILTKTTIKEFVPHGVVALTEEGKLRTLEADTVVLALGVKSEDKLVNPIKQKIREVHIIGDCASPRKIGEAIREGFVAGWKI